MKITIGVICYNHERYLSQCLDSLLNQTLQPHTIVVADDCSTDHSWEIIQAYQTRHPEIINGYRNAINRGAFHTGTFVEKNLFGDFVCMMDGDDFWYPEKIEFEYKAMQENMADIGHSDVTLVDPHNNVLGFWTKRPEIPATGDVFVNVMGRRYFKQSQSVFRNELVSRKAFDSDGWGDGALNNFWDWERKIRYAQKYRTAHTGKNLVAYRINPLGISHTQSKREMFSAMVHVYEKHQPLLEMRTAKERLFVRISFELMAAKQREQLGLWDNERYSYSSIFKRVYNLLCELNSKERIEMLQCFAPEMFVDLVKNISHDEKSTLFNSFHEEIAKVKAIIQNAINV
jgi:glycosyltransferase involved in cell wall biosynthesis